MKGDGLVKLALLIGIIVVILLLGSFGGYLKTPEQTEISPLEKSEGELQGMYDKAMKLYNQGKYNDAIELANELIDKVGATESLNCNNKTLLGKTHSLIADCYDHLGNLRKAAKARIRSATIYKKSIFPCADNYFDALKEYQAITDKYNLPNTNFADYAQRKLTQLKDIKSGEVIGKISLEKEESYGGVTISIFNGFETVRGITEPDGSYSLPFFKSSPETYISVFVSKKGYIPKVKNFLVSPSIRVPQMILQKLPDPGQGAVIGVCFESIRGGRGNSQYGIKSYRSFPLLKVRNNGTGETHTTKCKENGVYMLKLEKGNYTIVGPNVGFSLSEGETVIQNLELVRTEID